MRTLLFRFTLIAAAGLVAAACTNSDSSDATTTTTVVETTSTAIAATTSTRQAATTTSAADEPSAATEEALAIKDAFFIAFNSGDREAVISLFTEDARFVDDFGVESDPAEWESHVAWNIAQGTRYTPSDCVVSERDNGAVRVACPFKNHDILTLEVGGPPVPMSMWIDITQAGIVGYADEFGKPDFNTVARPFNAWMETHHPEDAEAVGFGTWASLEEAVAFGELRAGYAQEWAIYLEANNCVYTDGC